MCPNINSEEIKQQFNELVEALGGTPLTEEEFRLRDARRLRVGLDADAMDAAYAIWDLNNGYPIDQTPGGENSELFSWLLQQTSGDRNQAITLKSYIYSKKWIDSHPMESFQEPTVTEYRQQFDPTYLQEQIEVPITESNPHSVMMFGEDIMSRFKGKESVYLSSRQVINNIQGSIPKDLLPIFKAFSQADIQVRPITDMSQWMTYDSRSQTIYVNVESVERHSNAQNAYALAHELAHHYTVQSYLNPQNALEQSMKEQVDRLYDFYTTNIFKITDGVSVSDLYGLTNQVEFIAEILSNDDFKRLLVTDRKSVLVRATNALKRLINTFSRVLTGREVFSGMNRAQDIDKLFRTAMMVVQNNNKYGIREFTIPQDLEGNELNDVDQFIFAINKKNNSNFISDTSIIQNMNELERVHNSIKQGLNARLTALTRRTKPRRSQINEVKGALKDVIDNDSLVAIDKFLDHVNTTMDQAKRSMGNSLETATTKELVLYKTDFEGFYRPMMEEIQDVITNGGYFDNYPDYEKLLNLVKNLNAEMSRISSRYNHVLRKRTVQIIKEMSDRTGGPQQVLDHILNNINVTDEDISWIGMYAGMASNLKSDLIRLINVTMANQINLTKRNSLIKGNEIKHKWVDASKKYGIDAMKYFREVDSNGKYTGYFTRPIKYGQEKAEFIQEQERLAKKYKLDKDQYGNYILPAGDNQAELDVIFNYNKDINDWLGTHVERKYKPEYYAAMNRMTEASKEAMTDVNFQIQKILDSVMDDDGVAQTYKLNATQWNEYQTLMRDKAALSIEYDIDGNEKSGIELDIARNLRDVNGEINKHITYKKNLQAFEDANQKMKAQLSPREYNIWYQRNTREVLPDRYQQILEKFDTSKQSDLYKDLYDKRRQLLRLVRESDASKTNIFLVTDKMRAAIKSLDEQISDERIPSGKQTGQTFAENFEIIRIPEYYSEAKRLQSEGVDKYEKWYDENHYEDSRGYVHPISIWTQLVPRGTNGEANPALLERAPTQTWSEIDPSSDWYNPRFDRSSRETYQPKKSLYDNSQQWNELLKRPELKALYDDLISTMEDSYEKIQFMSNPDPYKLPQISARTMVMLTERGDLFKNLGWLAKDFVKVKDEDIEFIPEFQRMPNGEYIKHVPTRYLSMLDDPNLITSDTVGSVISFFEMAENYKNMEAIKDDMQAVMYTLQDKRFDNGKKVKDGKSLNEYQKIEHMLDTNLYGKRKERLKVNVKIGNKTYDLDISKTAFKLTNIVRNRNLVFNIWSMAANYITASTNNKLEAFAGRYFDSVAYSKAVMEYARQLPSLTVGIGRPGQVNKLLALCEYNQIARNNEEAFSRLDQSAVMRTLANHAWYGGYSMGDFAVKSKILMSVMFNYKLATLPDGSMEFMSKEQFMNTLYSGNRKKGNEAWSTLKDDLYRAYEVDRNNNVQVRPEFKKYITPPLENRIKNTANFLAARADGALTDLDRSKIHTNAMTQFLTLHRGFIINGIHDRFKSNQYNYLTGLYEEGLYQSAGRGVWGVISNTAQQTKDWTMILPQITSNWQNLKDYERYAVKKVTLELLNVVIWTYLIAGLLSASADDNKDDWAINALSYVALRSAFEFRSLYNVSEFFNLLKSPSAAVDFMDDIYGLLNIINPKLYNEVESGPYKGWKRSLRNFTKLTPIKNIVEAGTPRDKRKYLEGQLMSF